jgi:hypothetical protein
MNQNFQSDKRYFSSDKEEVELQKQVSTHNEETKQEQSQAFAVIGMGCPF